MADTSLDTTNNLPETEIREDNLRSESQLGTEGLLPKEEGQELDDKTKQGFQRLVAKKDEAISSERRLREEAERKLESFEREKRDRELAELSEVDRLRAERDEALSKMAQTELKSFVTAQMTERNLMGNPLAQDIIESPWLLRAVKSNLPSGANWQQTIDAVHEYLPAYLDTLVPANKVEPQNTLTEPAEPVAPVIPMDTERTVPSGTPGNKRLWTRAEIRTIGKDPAMYKKYQAEINQALLEGRVVE